MGISPIETVTMPPKSQEASFLKGHETQKPLHNQIVLQKQMEGKTEQDSRQTVRTQDAQNREYRYDAKEKGNNPHGGHAKKKKSAGRQADDKKDPKKLDGSSFDMRV